MAIQSSVIKGKRIFKLEMSLPRSVVPLESNPEVFTQFAQGLGLTPSYSFHDIYSLTEPDLMAFLPRPMKAIILLFPINEVYESTKDDVDQEQGASEGNTPVSYTHLDVYKRQENG